MNFWESFWWFLCVYALFAFLYALYIVIGDVISDDRLNGWAKAAWIFFLAFLPFLTLLVYMVVRGKGMAQRSKDKAREAQKSTDEYIRSVASASPSDEISKAKALLDAGTISAEEFERIKRKAMV